MRQAKIVASFRVKVPDGRNQRNDSVRFNQSPVLSVAPRWSVVSGFDCCIREQRVIGEAYIYRLRTEELSLGIVSFLVAAQHLTLANGKSNHHVVSHSM